VNELKVNEEIKAGVSLSEFREKFNVVGKKKLCLMLNEIRKIQAC
jgi:hypothetical protein